MKNISIKVIVKSIKTIIFINMNSIRYTCTSCAQLQRILHRDYIPTVKNTLSYNSPGHNCSHDGPGQGEVKFVEYLEDKAALRSG